MKDATAMSVAEIETELREANVLLLQARESGDKTGELETRVWRLLFEKRFRQTSKERSG